ncbi:hypothetical protein [Rhizorhabdus phycosphaerae]|uniref:hypothetical protein n=1 Tax=Rhizorhabdus phycosphaerae TaxID=2711156 RepID=UPI0019D165B3|nr:hypothetical protein [Rhizorhabdus phycosphaerae]
MSSTFHIQVPKPTPFNGPVPSTFSAPDTPKGGEGGKEGGPTSAIEPAPAITPPSPPLTVPVAEIVTAPPSPPSAEAVTENVIPLGFQGDDIFTPAPAINPVVAAAKERDLYQGKVAPGQHHITCPLASEHQSDDGAAIYFEPSENRPLGHFHCPHRHKNPYDISDLLRWLDVPVQQARCQPKIYMAIGEPHRVVNAAEKALAGSDRYYRSGESIVEVKTDPRTGDVAIEALSDQAMTMRLSAAAYWEKYDGRTKKVVRCEPSDRIVKMVLKGDGHSLLRPLSGLARQPFFRRSSHELVTTPGYDPASMIYAAFAPKEFALPEPTRENAMEALRILKQLVHEFHFDDPVDCSAALCAMLTAAIRPSLPLAPAFNISASMPGSGKSYLGSVIAPFAGPGLPLNVSYPTTAEEATKSIQSFLIGQPPVIMFDDMQTNWLPHGALNRMLTSETITDRLLGTSRSVTVSTASFFMGTGNNVEPIRDMCRRVVTIYLNAKTDSPVTLSYRFRPAEMVQQSRGHYVSAALTIIRAWLAAGSPKANIPNITSYERWSDLCRQPLVWLGQADPAGSLIRQVESDPDAETLGAFLREWYECLGEDTVTVRRLVDQAEKFDDLKDALFELPVTERGEINRSKLGWYLSKNLKRTVGGLQLHKAEFSERTAWKVVKVGEVAERVRPSGPPSQKAYVRI